jgi:anti-anti-sigma regulatory factor
MFKITQDASKFDVIRVRLHGLFTGDYVSEVEKVLALNDAASKRVALDLTNVTFVDRAAMEFLRAAKSRKIKMANLPSYVTRWIEQEPGNGSTSPVAR